MDTNPELVRAEFEAWAKSESFCIDIFKRTGQYEFANTEVAWLGWEACEAGHRRRAASSSAAPSDIPTWQARSGISRTPEGQVERAMAEEIADLRAALATTKPQAVEAVAWRIRIGNSDVWGYNETESDADFYGKRSGLKYAKQALYLATPSVQAVAAGQELTDADIDNILAALDFPWWDVPYRATLKFARAIERHLTKPPALAGDTKAGE